jgi:hypothetical protein
VHGLGAQAKRPRIDLADRFELLLALLLLGFDAFST